MAAQLDQVALGIALVCDEEDIDLVERRDGLHGQVLGMAGTDPDDADPSHRDLGSSRIGSQHRRDPLSDRRYGEQVADEITQLLVGLSLHDARSDQ